MSTIPFLSWGAAVLAAIPAVVAATPTEAPGIYRSTTAEYRPYAEGERIDWRAANAVVGRSHGHVGHAGHGTVAPGETPATGNAAPGHDHAGMQHDHGGMHR